MNAHGLSLFFVGLLLTGSPGVTVYSGPRSRRCYAIKFVPAPICPGNAVYRLESSKVLNNVMRDYQPIWRIRSRMSPL